MQSGEVRIIAGKWRSRKVYFPAIPSLRPTPNRIRETLFNWLTPYIQGARCLDLFAGSGALSFEAISRGANSALLLDTAPEIIAALRKTQQQFDCQQLQIKQATYPYHTELLLGKYDIVFLDPPFHQGLIEPILHWLVNSGCLNNPSYIYVESELDLTNLEVPSELLLMKAKKAGAVFYGLFVYSCVHQSMI